MIERVNVTTFNEQILAISKGEIGVQEIPGKPSHPRIVEYLESTTVDHGMAHLDETPWCSAFVNWNVTKAGFKGTNSAWARSWLKWGIATDKPEPGDIVVFSREGGGGHVAFYLREDAKFIYVRGGNQNNRVCDMPYPKNRFLGYRKYAESKGEQE